MAPRPPHHRPARLALDFEQAVVFRQPLGLPDGAGLELIAAPPDRQVGGPVVFRFAAAHADGYLPARSPRQAAGFGGFRQRPDLFSPGLLLVRRVLRMGLARRLGRALRRLRRRIVPCPSFACLAACWICGSRAYRRIRFALRGGSGLLGWRFLWFGGARRLWPIFDLAARLGGWIFRRWGGLGWKRIRLGASQDSVVGRVANLFVMCAGRTEVGMKVRGSGSGADLLVRAGPPGPAPAGRPGGRLRTRRSAPLPERTRVGDFRECGRLPIGLGGRTKTGEGPIGNRPQVGNPPHIKILKCFIWGWPWLLALDRLGGRWRPALESGFRPARSPRPRPARVPAIR